jgi:hypothetical protein
MFFSIILILLSSYSIVNSAASLAAASLAASFEISSVGLGVTNGFSVYIIYYFQNYLKKILFKIYNTGER